jgi:hypothetical protein
VVAAITAQLKQLRLALWSATDVQRERLGSERNPSAALAKLRASHAVLAVAGGITLRFSSKPAAG